MQKHSFYLCKFLAKNKIYVDLYHTASDPENIDLSLSFTQDELQYINSYIVPFPISRSYPGHYIRNSYKYSELLYGIFRKNERVDLIYAKGLTSWKFLKLKNSGEDIPPVAINVHGYEYYQRAASFKGFLQNIILRPAFRFVNYYADYIFSYGTGITKIIESVIPEAHNKIIEIPSGIEEEFVVERIKESKGKRKFVYLGRYESRKGIDELSRSIKALMGKYNFEFVFIGDIPQSKQISDSRIIYKGILKDKKVIMETLQNSDVLICPSYSEGMPNVILEGMASGCAIIASEVGAVPLMVKSKNGWLIDPGSVNSLKSAMVSAITIDKNSLEKMRRESVKSVRENFLWSDVIEKLMKSFEQIIAEDGRYQQAMNSK